MKFWSYIFILTRSNFEFIVFSQDNNYFTLNIHADFVKITFKVFIIRNYLQIVQDFI